MSQSAKASKAKNVARPPKLMRMLVKRGSVSRKRRSQRKLELDALRASIVEETEPVVIDEETLKREREEARRKWKEEQIKKYPVAPDGFIPNSVVRRIIYKPPVKCKETEDNIWKLKPLTSIVNHTVYEEKELPVVISSPVENVRKTSSKNSRRISTKVIDSNDVDTQIGQIALSCQPTFVSSGRNSVDICLQTESRLEENRHENVTEDKECTSQTANETLVEKSSPVTQCHNEEKSAPELYLINSDGLTDDISPRTGSELDTEANEKNPLRHSPVESLHSLREQEQEHKETTEDEGQTNTSVEPEPCIVEEHDQTDVLVNVEKELTITSPQTEVIKNETVVEESSVMQDSDENIKDSTEIENNSVKEEHQNLIVECGNVETKSDRGLSDDLNLLQAVIPTPSANDNSADESRSLTVEPTEVIGKELKKLDLDKDLPKKSKRVRTKKKKVPTATLR